MDISSSRRLDCTSHYSLQGKSRRNIHVPWHCVPGWQCQLPAAHAAAEIAAVGPAVDQMRMRCFQRVYRLHFSPIDDNPALGHSSLAATLLSEIDHCDKGYLGAPGLIDCDPKPASPSTSAFCKLRHSSFVLNHIIWPWPCMHGFQAQSSLEFHLLLTRAPLRNTHLIAILMKLATRNRPGPGLRNLMKAWMLS